MDKKVLWIAGLSNGETITEEKGNFKTIAGELSPWQRLLLYLKEKDLTITSLSLHTKDGLRWHLPSAGKNPKFHAFAVAPKPINLNMFRKMGGDVTGGGEIKNPDKYTIIEGEYNGGTKIQIWVDDYSLNSWSLIATQKDGQK